MARTLAVADGTMRVLSPTTTVRLAERILAASRVTQSALPPGFHSTAALNILLEMYVADDGGRRLSMAEVTAIADAHPRVMERWLAALVQEGLVSVSVEDAVLTADGRAAVDRLLSDLFVAQRALD